MLWLASNLIFVTYLELQFLPGLPAVPSCCDNKEGQSMTAGLKGSVQQKY